jgi:hypothetical protein
VTTTSASDMLREAVRQYHVQCSMHRIGFTGDWSELDDLPLCHLTWAQPLLPEGTDGARILSEHIRSRNGHPKESHG